ncbi:MAG: hypothetical protein ABR906_03755 [Terracidiphilus sp.]|jgi:hypothetical protein
MLCKSNSPAVRRYIVRFVVSMVLYAVFLALAVVIFVHFRPTGPVAWLLAVLPALAIIGQIAAFGMYLAEERDEFQRHSGELALLWGIGATLSVTIVWGSLENFVHLRHLDPTWIYPIFCIFFGIAHGLNQARYK